MELNYIIQAHNYPKQLKRLILRLNGNNVFFYVHIDRKSDIYLFIKELKEFKNVFLLKERIDVFWGHISQVEVTLIALKKIIEDKRTGYCILMSGQDYPIKSNNHIRDFFEINYGDNFIDSKPIEDIWEAYSNRITKYNFHSSPKKKIVYVISDIYSSSFYGIRNIKNIIKLTFIAKNLSFLKYIFTVRKHPSDLKPFGGSQWWTLPIETIHLIMNYIDSNKSFLKYHQHTNCPDEIFFHTLVSNLIDSQKIKESVTYVNWTRENTPLPVVFRNEEDLNELKETNWLFARKFDSESKILDNIDSELLTTTMEKTHFKQTLSVPRSFGDLEGVDPIGAIECSP